MRNNWSLTNGGREIPEIGRAKWKNKPVKRVSLK